MKRSFVRLFMIVMILASFVASSIQVAPGEALGYLQKKTLPTNGLTNNSLLDVWGTAAGAYAVGEGVNGAGKTVPILYSGSADSWASVPLSLTITDPPVTWPSGFLRAIWGIPGTIYAVGWGDNGTTSVPLLYYSNNGTSWTPSNLNLPSAPYFYSGKLFAIWGSSASNVYVVGSGDSNQTTRPLLYRLTTSWSYDNRVGMPTGWTYAVLTGVWGDPNGNVYAVGYGRMGSSTTSRPLIYRYDADANNWTPYGPTLPDGWTTGTLSAVWGSSESDIYAVGSGGGGLPLVYHSTNGVDWSVSSPALPSDWVSARLNDIWGSSESDLYALGSGEKGGHTLPVLFRYRSSDKRWIASEHLPLGWFDGYFQSLFGVTADQIYAVGVGDDGGTDYKPLLSYTAGDASPPGNVPSLAVTSGLCNGSVNLTWTDPADDGVDPNTGPVDTYVVRIKEGSPLANWSDGQDLATSPYSFTLPAPTEPLASHTMSVSGLTPGTTYYFAIKAKDEQGLVSAVHTADPGPEPAQAVERIGTWFIRGLGRTSYGAACDSLVPADYNGDRIDDIAVYRPSNGTWYLKGVGPTVYGTPEDIPVPADYNGDGKADIAVYRPSNGTWYLKGVGPTVYGTPEDIPVPADYNGDGKADIAVYRPSNGTWYIKGMGATLYGTSEDIPVPADYNGDGIAEKAVFRPSNGTWYIKGMGATVYGTPEDIPVPADYNGDGKAEMAVFRPSNGTWYLKGIGPTVYGIVVGDIPMPADYNGDGRADITVFRP